MKRLILFVTFFAYILLSSLFTGCQYDPFAGDMTTKRPKFKDVIGTYKFQMQTFGGDSVNKLVKYATLELFADSSFKATNIPSFVNDHFERNFSGHGKWDISIIGGIINGKDTVDEEWGITLSGAPMSLNNIGFTGNKAPYGLLITYGDPDEGAVVTFKKE